MFKTIALCLSLVALSACDPLGPTEEPTVGAEPAPCCAHYAQGSQVHGCWMCGGQLRCAGTECSVGSAAMPLCQAQPSAPYAMESPSCE